MVTLYGIIDAGLDFTTNAQTSRPAVGPQGGRQYSLQDDVTGGIRRSRWGLRGAEDLGFGIKAVFVLEIGFGIGTLAHGGAEFGRQAFVGLQSSFGNGTFGWHLCGLRFYINFADH